MGRVLKQDYRNDTFYRSGRPERGPAWFDCGVLIKNDLSLSYRNRVIEDRLVVVFLLQGSGLYVDGDGRAHRVKAGDLVPHVPGRRHSMVPDENGGWVEFFMQVPAVFFRALSDMGHLPDDDGIRHPGVRKDLLAGIDDLMDAVRDADELDAPRLLNQAHGLLNDFYRPASEVVGEGSHQAAIEAVCEALSGVDGAEVDVSAMAEAYGLSYERLRKLFREKVGLPPGEYRIRRRIDRARTMIAERGLSNKAVAFELGYPDPFAFSKQFKKYVGMSPSAFRAHL
ncbi:helix-turn-helix domain-containing protein [Algisphaera agarilytica]|uniref:AraC-like DNA-binding protein n=1 Tax=Algisphaera agarilytica TaxID=1385975 RepID=A0A7X0H9C5_9BACT|nr:AraC family transcriptional regulator [Algisphaera agarilytica]MBB6431621.1 AraC-like DNA-binding protein [Algisphaera agarilytica]